MRDGSDVAIIACGVMVSKSLEAAELLSEKGIEATVVDMHTIKPLDEELVKRLAAECKLIVTVEDHSVIGGLGGAVAEYLSENIPTRLRRVGVRDRFGESGQAEEMLELLNISTNDIINSVLEIKGIEKSESEEFSGLNLITIATIGFVIFTIFIVRMRRT